MHSILQKRKERGQVMLLGVMAMILLVFVMFILFDVQNLFRSKIKTQTAVDAASIAGANWQMHTLNAVGEMNLLKASALLLESDLFGIRSPSDSFGKVQGDNDQDRYEHQEQMKTADDGPLARVKNASDTLSQMQYRTLFILPLLGVGAAQQAAKNNGIAVNNEFNERVKQYLESLDGRDPELDLYTKFREEEFCLRTMYGFSWGEPYSGLLWQILQQGSISTEAARSGGFAVLPNMIFMGMPSIRSESSPDFSSYLGSKDFYDAIENDNFAALKNYVDLRTTCGSSNWWGKVDAFLKDSDFACESEMLPTRVRVQSLSGDEIRSVSWNQIDLNALPGALLDKRYHASTHDDQDPYVKTGSTYQKNSADRDDRITLLPALYWAVFKDKWADYDTEWIEYCRQILRSRFKPEAQYASGAVARMDAYVPSHFMTGYLGNKTDSSPSLGHIFREGKSFSAYNQRLESYQSRLRQDSSTSFNATALAKPFGSISIANGNPMTPPSLQIVLPVFTRSTLLPVFMEDPGTSPLVDWDWYRFLLVYIPTLGKSGSLEEIPQNLQSRFSRWHSLLIKVSNPAYIERICTWLDTPRPDMKEIYCEVKELEDYTPTNRDLCDFEIPPGLKNVPFNGSGGRHQVGKSGRSSNTKKRPARKY